MKKTLEKSTEREKRNKAIYKTEEATMKKTLEKSTEREGVYFPILQVIILQVKDEFSFLYYLFIKGLFYRASIFLCYK